MGGRLYSKREVANAGKAIAAYEGAYKELVEESAILEAWRQAHNRVMIDVKAELAQLVMEKCSSAVIVGRLKRADAIVAKLRRTDANHKLSMLQDIAGCRVIVDTLEDLELLSSLIIDHFNVAANDVKDHISVAKEDGYRSRHFRVRRNTSQYAGLRCEIQLRTRLQHSWATAVEVYDVISGSGLKMGKGSEGEHRLFKGLSLALSIKEFGQVEARADELKDVLAEVSCLNSKLNALQKLQASKGSVSILNSEQYRNNEYCLLYIDYALQYTKIYTYDMDHADEANAMYAELERAKTPMQDVLLVSVSSLTNLKKAYPNYSTDISLFFNEVDWLMDWMKGL